MQEKYFFEELGDEFDGHPYKDRLLEELEGHLEDLKADKDVSKENIIEQVFDAPKKIKKVFIAIVDPWSRILHWSEGFMLAVSGMLLAAGFFALLLGVYSVSTSGDYSKFTYFLLFQILWFAYYDPVFSHLKNIKPYTYRSAKFWSPFILAPGLFFFTYLSFSQLTYHYPNASPLMVILFILTYIFFNGLFGYFTWLMNDKRKKVSYNPTALKKVAGFFAFLVIGRTLITNVDPAFAEQYPQILFLFLPIFFIDAILVVPWNHLSLPPVLTYYLPGFFLFYVCLLEGFWILMQPKKWMLRSVVFLYVISLFFVSSNIFTHPLNFQNPSIDISHLIEKEKASIFHPYRSYMANLDHFIFPNSKQTPLGERSTFEYQVWNDDSNQDEPVFGIENNLGEHYYMAQTNLGSNFSTGTYKALIDQEGQFNTPLDKTNDEFHNQIPAYLQELNLGQPFAPSDFAFSEDEKWLLIVLPDAEFGQDGVYLLNLQQDI